MRIHWISRKLFGLTFWAYLDSDTAYSDQTNELQVVERHSLHGVWNMYVFVRPCLPGRLT